MAPHTGMKVVAELDLWAAMLEWLQPTITDQSPAAPVLDGPETPAQRRLMLDVLRDLARDVLAGIRTDPTRHKRVQIDLSQRIEIAVAQRSHLQARGHDGKQL